LETTEAKALKPAQPRSPVQASTAATRRKEIRLRAAPDLVVALLIEGSKN
jgi:hypothetical protein